MCTHMCSSLFCCNLVNTIDFHDDRKLDRFQEGYDGIGVTVITERVAEDEKNTHFLLTTPAVNYLLYKHKSIWQSLI